MAPTKTRNFGALAQGIAQAAGASIAPVTLPAASTNAAMSPSRAPVGRPAVDTVAFPLRPTRAVMQALVEAAATQSVARGRNITPQQVALKILATHFNLLMEDNTNG